MVKKQKNMVWLTWLLAVIAVIALILAIVAINKVNMTGESIFNWKNKAKVSAQQVASGSVGPGTATPPSVVLLCNIVTSSDCYSQGLNFSECDTCEEICSNVINETLSCDYAGRARYEGNVTYIPNYYEPINCDSQESIVQFKLYCNCCD